MENNIFKIKEKILNNKIPIGTHIRIGEPVIADILCNCDFDFLWIETEHSLIDRRDIKMLIITINNAGVASFIRVPSVDPVLVKPILDMGVAAIIFPLIKTIDEAKLAISCCRYPPNGIRGFGPIKADNYSIMNLDKYIETSKKAPWVILQIEHIEGVNNLEGIIKVDGVDSIVIGLNDLSGSIGLLGQTRHPRVLELVKKISNVCKQNNLPFGVSLGNWSEEEMEFFVEVGVSWISVGTDISYLVNGGKNTLENTKRIINKFEIQ